MAVTFALPDDTDWLVTRGDEEEAVDEIFADLFDENATTASGAKARLANR